MAKVALILLVLAAVTSVGHSLCDYEFIVETKDTNGAGTSKVKFTMNDQDAVGPAVITEQGSFNRKSSEAFTLTNKSCFLGCVFLRLEVIETAFLPALFSSAPWDCNFVNVVIRNHDKSVPTQTRFFGVGKVLSPSDHPPYEATVCAKNN